MNINPLFPVEIYEKTECLYEWLPLIKQLISIVTNAHARITNMIQLQSRGGCRDEVYEMMEN